MQLMVPGVESAREICTYVSDIVLTHQFRILMTSCGELVFTQEFDTAVGKRIILTTKSRQTLVWCRVIDSQDLTKPPVSRTAVFNMSQTAFVQQDQASGTIATRSEILASL